MGQILQINVYKFVQLDNMLRIQQECVCLTVQMDLLLIIMSEFVLLLAQQHQIYMGKM